MEKNFFNEIFSKQEVIYYKDYRIFKNANIIKKYPVWKHFDMTESLTNAVLREKDLYDSLFFYSLDSDLKSIADYKRVSLEDVKDQIKILRENEYLLQHSSCNETKKAIEVEVMGKSFLNEQIFIGPTLKDFDKKKTYEL